MENGEASTMEGFVDKLCDHLPAEKIKVLIDSGFDEWETITFMKGDELLDLGFDTQECIVVMVAANSNAAEHHQPEIFSEEGMQRVMAAAKEREETRK
jgi:hypothetical protein